MMVKMRRLLARVDIMIQKLNSMKAMLAANKNCRVKHNTLKINLSRLGDLTKDLEINHNELKAQVVSSASEIRNELAMQVSQVAARIERVERRVEELSTGNTFQTDRCVMIYHLSQPIDESEAFLHRKVEEIV